MKYSKKISVGIDLAGKDKNQTGFCFLKNKIAVTKILHTDYEIIENTERARPDIVAIDAPFLLKPKIRKCDTALKKYGAFPPTIKSMHALSRRGYLLAENLKKLGFEVIEVFPTASAKILGIYSKDICVMENNLVNVGIKIEKRNCTKHELDAVISALTGFLHLNNLSDSIGSEREGIIVVPKTSYPNLSL